MDRELDVKASAYPVAFSPDGRYLALGRGLGPIQVWDVGRGRQVGEFTGHAGLVNRLAFSPQGDVLGSASTTVPPRGKPAAFLSPKADHALRFCTFPAGEPIGGPVEVGESTSYLTILGDGSWVSFDTEDQGTVRRGRVHPSGAINTRDLGTGGVCSVAVSADGKWIATGNQEGMIEILDLDSVLPLP